MKRDTTFPYTFLIFAITLCIVFSLLAGTVLHNKQEYARTIESVNDDLFNYAQLVGEHTANVLDSADLMLLLLRHAYVQKDNVGELLAFMAKRLMPYLELNQIGIIDAHGLYVASSLPAPDRIDLSDREHFRFHAEGHGDVPYISKPLTGRATKKLSIQLSRRITMPDGSFGGVVVASINPYYFSKLYDQLRLGHAGLITIVGLDGIVRARRNLAQYSSGQDIRHADLFKHLRKAPVGFYRRASLIDGVDRLFAYKKLERYPLVVLVGTGYDDAMRLYRDNARMHTLFAGSIMILSLFFGGLIMVALRKRRLMFEQVQASRRQAEAANRSKTDFLAKVTHEVRTPLHAVTGLTDYLLHTPLTDDQRDCLSTVRQSADHLLGMVNDLLDISKIEAGQLELEAVPFDLRGVFLAARRILAPLAEAKGIDCDLDWQSEPDAATVVGDPRRLRQIILNLGGNAIKFTTTGGVRIRARSRPAERDALVRLEVAVTDTGSGIPEAVRETIFQPFTQADASIAGQYGGTGLGLTICRQLVERMGGSLTVESTVGEGSVFRFAIVLPRGDAAAIPPPAPEDLTLPPLALMVVDDNPINIKVAVKLLDRLGQSPEHAGSGTDALAALRGKPYDVVLLDIELQDMNGFELTRRVRAGEAGPDNRDVPIIAMTAHSLRTFRQECLDAGMQGFVAKPIEVERLHAVLAGLAQRGPRLERPGRARDDRPRPAATGTREAPLVDIPAALERLAGDRQLYQGVFEDFVEKYGRESVPDPGDDGIDAAALTRYAHTLKGLARTLGADPLAFLAEQVELAAGEGRPEAASALVPQLRDRLTRTIAAIREAMEGMGV